MADKTLNSLKKCLRDGCNYKRHQDITNNNGQYCCGRCEIRGGHGSLCKKIPFVERLLIVDNEHEYISGLAFYKITNWSFCLRYPSKLEPQNFKIGDRVFLDIELFEDFLKILKETPPASKFTLITHNSDKCFSDYHYNLIKDIVTNIYAINCVIEKENVIPIPIGFRDKNIPLLKSVSNQKYEKEILIYMNFSIGTNAQKRRLCYLYFNDKNWVTKRRKRIPITEYNIDMAKSKYIISPLGEGIDCYRVYESIYFDCVPIIKSNRMNMFYKDLPVLIVYTWGEVTENMLLSKYEYLKNRLDAWKEANSDWLNPMFWINRK